MDGNGYPDGLKGANIPLMSRILTVADVYKALTSDRSYRAALPREEARRVMEREMGSHFVPLILHVFFGMKDHSQL